MSPIFALSKLLIKEIFRKKDFYVALILIGVSLFYASKLQFYNVNRIVRYLMEIGLALIYLFSMILTVTLAARQYPSEVQNGTYHVLFAKPLRRIEFVIGKFFGSFIAGAACFAVFFGLFLAAVFLKSGLVPLVLAGQCFYLFLLNLMVAAAMASAFSYYFTVSAGVTLSIIIYLLISIYGSGLRDVGGKLFWLSRALADTFYYLLPHFEFFDLRQRFIHAWNPLPASLLVFLTLYAIFYTTLFLWIGWLKLRREYL